MKYKFNVKWMIVLIVFIILLILYPLWSSNDAKDYKRQILSADRIVVTDASSGEVWMTLSESVEIKAFYSGCDVRSWDWKDVYVTEENSEDNVYLFLQPKEVTLNFDFYTLSADEESDEKEVRYMRITLYKDMPYINYNIAPQSDADGIPMRISDQARSFLAQFENGIGLTAEGGGGIPVKIDENIKPLYVYKQSMTNRDYEVQSIKYEYIFWKMRLQLIFIYLLGGASFLRAFYMLTVENAWLTGKGIFTVAALVGIIIAGIIVPNNIYHKKLEECGSEELFTYVLEFFEDHAIEHTNVHGISVIRQLSL